MDQHRSGSRKGTRKGTRWDGEALWDWNLESNRIHFSPRWISLVGHEDHELGNVPDEWFQRVHPDDSDQLLRDIETARAEASEFEFRYRLRHKDGTHRWMAARGVVVRNELGEAIRLTGSQSDVTVETVTDSLTGLPNRLLLLDRLTQSIERARRYKAFHFAVLIIDLGRPTGHGRKAPSSAGDPLLTAAARRLETCLRVPEMTSSVRHHDLVARLDGDHFAILLDGLKDVGQAKVVADRILREILHPFALSGREVRVSASVGIAVSASGYTRADDVLRDAETALHRAQVLGGSHCELFDTAILKSEQNDLQLENEFEGALERREFELFYQPIVSLTSNQVVGFEALVRWQHPVLGLISPLDFIPLAETTGFIVPLGHWILRDACLRLRAWQTSLPLAKDVWISVNLSSVQVEHEEVVEQIAETLRESGLDPRCLVLELTEGIAMENPASAKSLLMRLRSLGVRISIDDFGTGYSSLAYLCQFPVDALKVDRSFVRGMTTDKDTAEIVASLTAMARQLDLHVVAEGVENEDQLALLRSLRCASAQGELFAKPLDAGAAAALLTTGLPERPERPRRQVPAPFLARHAHVARALAGRGGFLSSGKRLAIAASLVGVLASAGLAAALFNGASPRVEPSPPRLRVEPTPADPAQQPAARPAENRAPQIPRPASAAFDVLHLHRIGSCLGRLVVSGQGVAFVPDSDRDDAFTLKYADFIHALEEETLTVRTASRTYRFKAAGGAGKADRESRLRNVADRIEGNRSR
jgi:diguanylate cyclase (GGDEF)-like protein/PAS domain S-box-containing protein